MAIQRKVTANLDQSRQDKLAEILAEEPLVTAGGLLALGVEVIYRHWLGEGRDLKRVLRPQCGDRKPVSAAASSLAVRKTA